MKLLEFVGSSLDDLKGFPAEARRAAGFELSFVQRGLEPSDWKPMKEVGAGEKTSSWLVTVTARSETGHEKENDQAQRQCLC